MKQPSRIEWAAMAMITIAVAIAIYFIANVIPTPQPNFNLCPLCNHELTK